jgi:hypothetical protein
MAARPHLLAPGFLAPESGGGNTGVQAVIEIDLSDSGALSETRMYC